MNIKVVGAKIKSLREQRNMTQEQLAEAVNLSTNHISVIERGVKTPKLDTFVDIANALGVSADEILVDVIDKSTEITASILSQKLQALPASEQRKVLSVIDTLLKNYKGRLSSLIFFTKFYKVLQALHVKLILKN